MIVFPKRVHFEFVVAAAMLLGSCSDDPARSHFTMAQRDEVRDLAREATNEDIASLKDRVDAIEQKLNMPNGGE